MTSICNIWKQVTSILSNLNNFYSLEVSETQLQVGENSDWIIWRLKFSNLAEPLLTNKKTSREDIHGSLFMSIFSEPAVLITTNHGWESKQQYKFKPIKRRHQRTKNQRCSNAGSRSSSPHDSETGPVSQRCWSVPNTAQSWHNIKQ